MMCRKISMSLGLFISLAFSSTICAEVAPLASILYKEDPLAYLEHIFVTELDSQAKGGKRIPDKDKNHAALENKLISIFGGVFIGYLAGFGFISLRPLMSEDIKELFANKLASAVVAIVSSVVSGGLIHRLMNSSAKYDRDLTYQILKKFILEWEEKNKVLVPEELCQFFEGIITIYQQEGEKRLREVSDYIVRLLRRRIYTKFPKRYERRLESLNRDVKQPAPQFGFMYNLNRT